jgi:Protein of unknown function (DUF3892)
MQELEITCVRESNGVITHVGIGGWLEPVETVVYWLQNGTVTAYTIKNGFRAKVYPKQNGYGRKPFLTTEPDSTGENKLDFLRACPY